MHRPTTIRVPCDAAGLADSIGSQLVRQLADRWRRGRRCSADELLAEHAEVAENSEIAVRLVYEEICQREEAGDAVQPDEVLARYPQWRSELAVLLDCHRLMGVAAPRPQFPRAGEQLGDFQLVAELDRGSAGRVFLATQPSLSDRPVALKLTASRGHEHLSLARLQHAYIVPLHLVQDFPERGLRALCMPYVGGMSLARVLAALADVPPASRCGRHVSDVLRDRSPVAGAVPGQGPAVRFFARASYVQTVCWIGACLADALDYAHQRGLLHLDVKPANVLLAADGQPMLLDFHLAREPIEPRATALPWMGGTLGYMSPEQHAALAAVQTGVPLPTGIDARADVYSLGMLLYEALGGPVPSPHDESSTAPMRPAAVVERADLSCFNSQVSPGLQGIIHKCLAADPNERYADAASLAEDLRRHLAHLPLKEVANRNLTERWRKWRGRSPHALTRAALLVSTLAAVTTLGLGYVSRREHAADAALVAGRQHRQAGDHDLATQAFQRGLSALEGLPWRDSAADELQAELSQTRRAAVAQRLGRLVDRLRILDAGNSQPAAIGAELATGCRDLWAARHKLRAPDGVPHDAATQRQVEADLADLAIFWADLQRRLAKADTLPAARRAALATLTEAEDLFGPSPALLYERQQVAEELALTDVASRAKHQLAELPPRTGREHYALGRALLCDGNLAAAGRQFQRAIEREPQSFWSHFYYGTCAFRQGEHREAVQAFAVCAALSPQRAECVYNRALAYTALGEPDRALRDYDRALELDPGLANACLNRALLHCQGQRYEQAESDLRRSLEQGADPAKVHYTWGLVHLAQNQRTAALGSVRTALAHTPQHAEALALLQRLQSEQ